MLLVLLLFLLLLHEHCLCLQEWEERTEEDRRLEQQQKKDEDRKRIREEKARLARLAAIQVPTFDSLRSLSVLHFHKVGRLCKGSCCKKGVKTDAAEAEITLSCIQTESDDQAKCCRVVRRWE